MPLPWVRVLFVASLVASLAWVMRLPRAATTPRPGAVRRDEDLKVWAGLAPLIQILSYSFL